MALHQNMSKAATAHGILESIKQILNDKAIATFLGYPPIIEFCMENN